MTANQDSGSEPTREHDWSHVTDHFATRSATVQGAFLRPFLRSGMALLDCGCGPGSITLGFAEILSPGEVVGIDTSAHHIEAARHAAQERGIHNARFDVGDIYQLPFPDCTFDAAFSNAVLQYLYDPVAALQEMRRVLKPGGIVGVRNPDHDGCLLWPDDPLLRRHLQAHRTVSVNGTIGREQRGLLKRAGFVRAVGSATYECYASDEATRYWGRALAGLLENRGYLNLITPSLTEEDRTAMATAWRNWSEHPDAFFADGWSSAVGWRE